MTLGGRGSEESLELEVLKGSREQPLSQAPDDNPSCTSQPSATATRGSHHRSSHHRSNHHHANQHHGGPPSSSQPLQSSGSANNIRDWGMRRGGSREDYTPDCVACIRAPCQSQRSLDLDTSPRDAGKHRKKLERMYSEDRASTEDRGKKIIDWGGLKFIWKMESKYRYVHLSCHSYVVYCAQLQVSMLYGKYL